MTRQILCMATALALLGCHSSTSILGDTRTDAALDVGHDTVVDTAVDPVHDTSPDTLPDSLPFCEEREGAWMSFEVEYIIPPHEEVLDALCNVEFADEFDGGWEIMIHCMSPEGLPLPILLHIDSNPSVWLPVYPGEELTFTHIVPTGWYLSEYIKLGYPGGGLILGAMAADSLSPWGWAPDDWFESLDVSVVRGDCPAVPESCGPLERRALFVRFGGESEVVFDGTHRIVGTMLSIDVIVDTAQGYIDMECDDIPDEWYSALFVPMLEG